MNRIGLVLLTLLLVSGLAGCSTENATPDADPVGTWILYRDTGCDGSTNNTYITHFYENGTLLMLIGGTWTVDGDGITMNINHFLFGSIVFTGTVIDNNAMSGSFSSTGLSGCWTATKTSNNP